MPSWLEETAGIPITASKGRRPLVMEYFRNPNPPYRILFLALFVMAGGMLSSCHPDEFNTADELKAFIDEPANNLAQIKSISGYQIRVSYTPADLLIYQETKGEPTDHQKLFHLEKKYDDSYYFVVTLIKNGQQPEKMDTLQNQFNNFSTSLAQYFSLTTSEADTLDTEILVVSQPNVLKATSEILIVVSKEQSRNKEWIKFNLDEFGIHLGDHEFKFQINDLNSVPKLRFKLIS